MNYARPTYYTTRPTAPSRAHRVAYWCAEHGLQAHWESTRARSPLRVSWHYDTPDNGIQCCHCQSEIKSNE